MNKHLVLGARLLLGLIFLVFGLNGLMMAVTGNGFIPMPPPPPEMMTIMTGFMATGYLMALVKILEVIAGALLLWGRYLNAALVMLGPIVVNILGIHIFAERSGLVMSIVIAILYLIVLKSRWNDFKPLLAKN